MAADEDSLVLGIDFGTTSLKISLVDRKTHRVIDSCARPTNAAVFDADLPSAPAASEHDITKIFATCRDCLQLLTSTTEKCQRMNKIARIGVTGQMHGCVLWKSGLTLGDLLAAPPPTCVADDAANGTGTKIAYSPLFTWQDGRCDPTFLDSLPDPDSHLKLATGHGCATLFWLQRYKPEFLDCFDRAGTIMDLFVALLCRLDFPVMSIQNAASWGYFNCPKKSWNIELLSKADFPVHLLPEVKPPGCIVGNTKACWEGLPAGVDVSVAMGDLPCTMLPVLQSPHDAVISISTSAQVVTTTAPGFSPPHADPSSPVEYFPFFQDTYLSVIASLNGGNVLASLISTLRQWITSLGLCQNIDEDGVLFDKLIQLGMQCDDTTLEINPLLNGERHQPDKRGIVANISLDNVSLGDVMRATCRGIARNLSEMLLPDRMRERGVNRVVGCGSALLRNPVLKQEVERAFVGLPFVYSEQGDASLGAALAMCKND